MSAADKNKDRHRITELTQEIRDHQFKYYVLVHRQLPMLNLIRC